MDTYIRILEIIGLGALTIIVAALSVFVVCVLYEFINDHFGNREFD